MVIVPLAVLGWLGVRLDASERAERDRLIDQVLIEQLRNYDQTIANVVAKCADDVSKTLANAPLDGGDLRELQLSTPYVTQFFVLDANNVLRYPTLQGDTLPAEEDFLLRTLDIWMNGELATQGAEEQLSQSPGYQSRKIGQKTSVSKASVNNVPPSQRAAGWYVWHWGSDIHLIYWTRRSDGNVVGAEVNRARLTANIVATLPQTGIDRALSEPTNDDGVPGSSVPYVRLGTRGELRNSRGEAIYIWLNRFNAENARPRVSLPLSYPLSNWSLAFSVDPATLTQVGSGSLAFRLMARLGAVAIALIGLAVFFYRESARAMREAAQRVTFVNQVSHELKTPLTNIRMYAEMLDQNLDDADEQSKRQIGVLVSESQRLTRLIANILTFSRKERKGLSLRYTAGSIDPCIESVIAQFRPALEAKGV